MHQFSRENPSPRYTELLGYYKTMHDEGAENENISAANTFDGRSMLRQAPNILSIIKVLGSETILDYGAGKGIQYGPMEIKNPDGETFSDMKSYWNVRSITCFDPGHEPFSQLPEGNFDGVVTTDVLEHCPKDDIPWILHEIFSYAREFVYLNVACYPAKKTLPNGENAHCTLESPDWWKGVFDTVLVDYPNLRYYAVFDVPADKGNGTAQIETVQIRGKNRQAGN